MIKNAIKDPLQEEMLVREFREECEHVEASPYGFGEAAAMIYEAEIEQAWNALMEQVGIAELKFYNEYGMLLNINEGGEGEDSDKASLKDKAANAAGAAKEKAGELADAAKEKATAAKDAAKAAGSAFVKKVVEILEKIQATIQSLWKAAVQKFKEFDIVNKQFIARYKVALLGMKDKTIKIENGIKFNNEAFTGAFETLKGCENTIEKIVSTGGSEEGSSKKLCEELFKTETIDAFLDGLVERGSIERSVGEAFKGLESFGGKIVGAEKLEAQANAAINGFKKSMVKEDAHGNINMKATLIKVAAGWCSKITSAYTNALKEEVAVNKNICKQALANRVQGAKDAAGETVNKGKEAAGKAGEAVKNAAGKVGDAAKGAAEKIKGGKGEPAATGESATFNSMSVNSILESVNFA